MKLTRIVLHVMMILSFCLSLKVSQGKAISLFNCAAVTEIPLTECSALVALYTGTNGDNWTSHTNWLASNTVSTWEGIGLYQEHVAVIQLDSHNLTGPIPSQLGDLPQLSTLLFGYNHLSGTIPTTFSNLTNLNNLDLGGNQLSGTIPDFIGTMTRLSWLYLRQNQFTGSIPSSLGNLTNLNNLQLWQNQLSGPIPDLS